jgi:uncharacterized protein (TIGR03437 family)
VYREGLYTVRNLISKTILWVIGGVALAAVLPAQTTPTLTASVSALSFSYQVGAAALPVSQSVQIAGAPLGVAFTVTVAGSPFNAAWLLVSASVGVAPLPLKVQVNPTGLAAGAYTGTITITGTTGAPPPTKTITVTVLISNPPATLIASPTALNFSYTVGGPIPDPTLTGPFILSSNGAALSATISVANAPWLKISPSGNISVAGLFDTITVTVNPTGLTPKTYTGTVTIAAPAATNKTQTITVALTVNAVAPVALGTFPAGLIQASPQSIVTLLGTSFYPNSTVAVTGFTPITTITVTDSAGTPATASETLGIPVFPTGTSTLRIALASTFPSGTQSIGYIQTLAAVGGTGPYAWGVSSGALPPGILILGNTLFGTPLSAGSYTFTLQVTDSGVPSSITYQVFRLTVYPTGSIALAVTVSAAPLPSGLLTNAYNQTLTASGGTPPYIWSATGLPFGLALSSTGVLSGTPTSVGVTGALTSAAVSNSATLVTVPGSYFASPGTLRLAITTPSPGGGVSNDAQLAVYGPAPQIFAVVNSASFKQGTITPGEIITIFGTGLGPAGLAVFNPSAPPIPFSLPATSPATSVKIGGVSAPLIYTSATQVAAIVPYTIVGPSAGVVVTYGTQPASLTFTVGVVATDPGVYTTAASGQGQGAVLNYNAATADYTVNSTAAAAAKGAIVVLYVTGAGPMTSAVSNALIPALPAVFPIAPVTVTIGGQAATINAAQAPPGSVPGVLQINLVVPATAPTGAAIPLVVNIGGVDSQANVTMAVK